MDNQYPAARGEVFFFDKIIQGIEHFASVDRLDQYPCRTYQPFHKFNQFISHFAVAAEVVCGVQLIFSWFS